MRHSPRTALRLATLIGMRTPRLTGDYHAVIQDPPIHSIYLQLMGGRAGAEESNLIIDGSTANLPVAAGSPRSHTEPYDRFPDRTLPEPDPGAHGGG